MKSVNNHASLGFSFFVREARVVKFLEQMDRVVHPSRLVDLIAPHYPAGRTGRSPFVLETMLRTHFLQQWFNLSDLAMEEAIFDTLLYREFVGLLDNVRLPDESTVLNFVKTPSPRHCLEKHDLAVKILTEVNAVLGERGLMLKKCTQAHRFPHGHEKSVWADAEYQGVEKRPGADPAVTWYVAMRPGIRKAFKQAGEMGELLDRAEKFKPGIRAKVERPFRVIKRQFGYMKTRYRGLKKNAALIATLFALSNLWMARHDLMGVRA